MLTKAKYSTQISINNKVNIPSFLVVFVSTKKEGNINNNQIETFSLQIIMPTNASQMNFLYWV